MTSTSFRWPSLIRQISGWVVSLLLAFVFLGAGGAKLAGQPMMIEQFRSFGYPIWFMYLIGVVEFSCAVLVLIPRMRRIAAVGLACIMVGAMGSLLLHGPHERVAGPAILLCVALAAYQLRGGSALQKL